MFHVKHSFTLLIYFDLMNEYGFCKKYFPHLKTETGAPCGVYAITLNNLLSMMHFVNAGVGDCLPLGVKRRKRASLC